MLRLSPAALVAIALVVPAGSVFAATTACSSVAACVLGTNSSTGYGVEGTSKSGNGVLGVTTYNATSHSNSKHAVEGYDDSTSSKGYNTGVYGLTKYGTGVRGDSTSGSGIIGTSKTNAGVVGKSGSSYGVTGSSVSSFGVYGTSNDTHGIFGSTYNLFSAGVYGYAGYDDEQNSGIGVVGDSADNVGVKAMTESSEVGPSIALQAVAGDDGVTLFEGDSGVNAVATIDASGNMILAGSLQQNGSPFFRTSGVNGSSVTTFGDRLSQPTLEDLGEAQLVDGKADIALDARFGASVDQHARYLVFLTPMGDTRGLYVSRRSVTGFTVREVGGGRSSLVFDYRIAAKPYDSAEVRLPSTRTLRQLRHNVGTAAHRGLAPRR